MAIKESERRLRTLTSRLVSASDSPAIFLWRPAAHPNGYGTSANEGASNYLNASSPFVLIVSSVADRKRSALVAFVTSRFHAPEL